MREDRFERPGAEHLPVQLHDDLGQRLHALHRHQRYPVLAGARHRLLRDRRRRRGRCRRCAGRDGADRARWWRHGVAGSRRPHGRAGPQDPAGTDGDDGHRHGTDGRWWWRFVRDDVGERRARGCRRWRRQRLPLRLLLGNGGFAGHADDGGCGGRGRLRRCGGHGRQRRRGWPGQYRARRWWWRPAHQRHPRLRGYGLRQRRHWFDRVHGWLHVRLRRLWRWRRKRPVERWWRWRLLRWWWRRLPQQRVLLRRWRRRLLRGTECVAHRVPGDDRLHRRRQHWPGLRDDPHGAHDPDHHVPDDRRPHLWRRRLRPQRDQRCGAHAHVRVADADDLQHLGRHGHAAAFGYLHDPGLQHRRRDV